MKGTVYHINHQQGMYSVLMSSGNFIVFELLDSNELNVEDEVSGDVSQFGDATFKNLTSDEFFDVYIERLDCSEQSAKEGCFLI